MEFETGSSAFERQDVEKPVSPVERPARTWAGHGSGAACDVCGKPIGEHDIEYEVELPPGSPIGSLRFHFMCYQSWSGS